MGACRLNAQTKIIKRLDGSEVSTAQVDAAVNRVIKAAKIDGLCIAVLNDNKVVYQKGYGYKNAQAQTPLDTATVMYGASFSKAVFGFVSMHLVQQGLLDLDKPLVDYTGGTLADIPLCKGLAEDPRSKKITARMCLSHTTGLPNLWWMDPYTGVIDTNAVMKLWFNPGDRYAYSGEGLKILQKVEEKITGKNLEQLAQQFVFQPAGMQRTSYVWQTEFEANSASGHDEQGKAVGKLKSGRPNGAGSLLSTIEDYGKFITYVLSGKGLAPAYYSMMIAPHVRIHSKNQFPTMRNEPTTDNDNIALSYGLGWGTMNTPYGRAFFKEGHHDYWRNYNINFPDKGISLVIMSNSANGEGVFKELLAYIIADTFTPWQWEGYVPYDMTVAK